MNNPLETRGVGLAARLPNGWLDEHAYERATDRARRYRSAMIRLTFRRMRRLIRDAWSVLLRPCSAKADSTTPATAHRPF